MVQRSFFVWENRIRKGLETEDKWQYDKNNAHTAIYPDIIYKIRIDTKDDSTYHKHSQLLTLSIRQITHPKGPSNNPNNQRCSIHRDNNKE